MEQLAVEERMIGGNGDRRKRATPKLKPKDDPELLEWYDALYALYPRHDAKQAGWKAFKALKPTTELLDRIADDIEAKIADGTFKPDENWKFVPMISTYLNQRRWEDHA
jgi:hypothetical protein